MKTKIRDANSKLTEWNASLHSAWARKLWACVGWQSTWGKCHATFAFSLYFSLGVHFWSLLATWLLAGWAFSWSWHKCFLSLCTSARFRQHCTIKHRLLTYFLMVLHGWGSRREVSVELFLFLAPVLGKSMLQQAWDQLHLWSQWVCIAINCFLLAWL